MPWDQVVFLHAHSQRGIQGGTGHSWHRIGHPFHFLYLIILDVSVTHLVFHIVLCLVHFQPLTRTLLRHMFIYGVKKSQSREDIDNELMDTTEQVTYNNMKQSLSIQILCVLLRISSDKTVLGLFSGWCDGSCVLPLLKFKWSRGAFLSPWSKHGMNIRSCWKINYFWLNLLNVLYSVSITQWVF